jgi:AcrR family transcriptional regulator
MADTRIRGARGAALPTRLRPRKEPIQARSRATVGAIAEAASRILMEGGWEALSMQALAVRAGVSPGTLYQYFPDKPSVVAHLIEAQSRRELAFHLERFAAVGREAPLARHLDALLEALLEFQRREGPLMRATLDALAHLGRYEALSRRSAEAAQALRALLDHHRTALPPDLDVDRATHVLANAIHSLTHDGVLRRPASLDDAALLHELRRLVHGYLGLTPA